MHASSVQTLRTTRNHPFPETGLSGVISTARCCAPPAVALLALEIKRRPSASRRSRPKHSSPGEHVRGVRGQQVASAYVRLPTTAPEELPRRWWPRCEPSWCGLEGWRQQGRCKQISRRIPGRGRVFRQPGSIHWLRVRQEPCGARPSCSCLTHAQACAHARTACPCR